MYCHSVFLRFLGSVSLAPQEKTEEVAVFLIDVDLVEHSLYVAGKCYRFLSEATQDADQGVCQIGSL